MTLHFDKPTLRKLWDNYYVPYIKGWCSASGKFRSDDIKIGSLLAYVGSSSSASFGLMTNVRLPRHVSAENANGSM